MALIFIIQQLIMFIQQHLVIILNTRLIFVFWKWEYFVAIVHGISACEWHTAQLLRQTEQSKRDINIKNETLRQIQKGFQFSHCELSIYIRSNIQASLAYEVSISYIQLIRYFRARGFYHDFLDSELLLTRKLLSQGFPVFKLKSSLPKCYARHHDLVILTVTEYIATNDHGYVQLVDIAIRVFPYS